MFFAVISIKFDKLSVSKSSLMYASAKPTLPLLTILLINPGLFILILAINFSFSLPKYNLLPS